MTAAQDERFEHALLDHGGILLTGIAGIGKSYLLRQVGERFAKRGFFAPVLRGTPLGAEMPLGVFLETESFGSTEVKDPRTENASKNPNATSIVSVFARQRSRAVLLIDDCENLDEVSLRVVDHLVRNVQIPALLATRDIRDISPVLARLYDGGDLLGVELEPLTQADADVVLDHVVDGSLTPEARRQLISAANGNPLHLREIVAGSIAQGTLEQTSHGWEFTGLPAPTPRLGELAGARYESLSHGVRDAAALIAIAGEYPPDRLEADHHLTLTRNGIIRYSDHEWLRLTHPLDRETLRAQYPPARWRDLTQVVVNALRDAGGERTEVMRRADRLSLEINGKIDARAARDLARHSLAAFDERLALRAAQAAITAEPTCADAHCLAGLAASALGSNDQAEASFAQAQANASTPDEVTRVALSYAQHHGLRRYDANRAVAIIDTALSHIEGSGVREDLQRSREQWAAAAGIAAASVRTNQPLAAMDEGRTPEEAQRAEVAVGMLSLAVAGVVSGPLDESLRLIPQLGRLSQDALHLIPGGKMLLEVTAAMALCYTGDVQSGRRRFRELIARSKVEGPEALGTLEYGLGIIELLSGSAERAYELGCSAVRNLKWRDLTGRLPAAQALVGATAVATGRETVADREFAQIPAAATNDPRVVMLIAWAEAWRLNRERAFGPAAQELVRTATWLLKAQHPYFAALLAHCAVRLGWALPEAAVVLEKAEETAGGGLLAILVQHADAASAQDQGALERVATEAAELGLATMAADIRERLAITPNEPPVSELWRRRQALKANRIHAEHPGMALWGARDTGRPDLSPRESAVAELAATRLTTKEIAQRQGVSPNTVTNQLAAVFRKLGVSGRAELREIFFE